MNDIQRKSSKIEMSSFNEMPLYLPYAALSNSAHLPNKGYMTALLNTFWVAHWTWNVLRDIC